MLMPARKTKEGNNFYIHPSRAEPLSTECVLLARRSFPTFNGGAPFFPGFVVFVCERRKKLRQLVFGLINLLRVLLYKVIVNLFYNRFLIQHRLSFITGRAGMPELSCHHFCSLSRHTLSGNR